MGEISPVGCVLITIFSVLGLLIIIGLCLRDEQTIIDEVKKNREDYQVKSFLK